MQFHSIQNSFLAGELSPKIDKRTDLDEYKQGLSKLENFIPHPSGGANRRTGSQYAVTTFNDTAAILVPFVFSKTEKYMLIIPEYNFDTSHRNEGCQFININTGLVGNVNASQRSFSGVGGSADGSGLGDFPAIRLNLAQLYETQFAQSGDRLILVHPNITPRVFSRLAENTIEINEFFDPGFSSGIDVWETFPYRDINPNTGHLLTPSGLTGSITLSSSIAFFDVGHIGSLFKLRPNNTGNFGVVVVTAVTNSTTATVSVLGANLSAAAPCHDWEESAWSDYRGWPRTVAFYQNRVMFGGNRSEPDVVWGSRQYNIFVMMQRALSPNAFSKNSRYYFNFDEDTPEGQANNINEAFNFSVSANEPNQIQWLSPGRNLEIGTHGREYIISAPNANESLHIRNISVSPETAHGCEYVQPVRVANATTFVDRSARKIREMVFNFDEEAFRADSLIKYSEHFPTKSQSDHATITAGKIIRIAYQEAAESSVLWCIDNNGGLWGIARDRQIKLMAPHNHKLGGTLDSEIPKVISVATAPSIDGTGDDVWLVVKRTINNATKYAVEKMGRDFDLEETFNTSTLIADKMVYLDSCGFKRQTTPATSFLVAPHLAGQTVSVVADGRYLGTSALSTDSNKITNPGAEVDTSGWNTYRDVVRTVAGSNVADLSIDTIELANIFRQNERIAYTTTGTVIKGLTNGRAYYVVNQVPGIDGSFQLSHDPNGTPINLLSQGTGTHTFASMSPEDGTGGSVAGVLTFSRTTSTDVIMSGVGSFQMQFAGVDASGVGVSTDFTIASSNEGKEHTLLVDFRLNNLFAGSLRWVEGGLELFILNPADNSFVPVVQTATFDIDYVGRNNGAVIGGGGRFVARFTPPMGFTTFRLCIHRPIADSLTTIMNFDNVKVSAEGTLTTSSARTEALVGYSYNSDVQSLRLDAGIFPGSALGQPKRIDQATLTFHRTIGAKFGRDFDHLESIEFRPATLPMEDPVPLFTGDKVIKFPGDVGRDARIVIRQDLPFPCHVCGWVLRGLVNE